MKLFATEFRAICQTTGELKTYGGPNMPAFTLSMAKRWCFENAGYLEVVGELSWEVDWFGNSIDHKRASLN